MFIYSKRHCLSLALFLLISTPSSANQFGVKPQTPEERHFTKRQVRRNVISQVSINETAIGRINASTSSTPIPLSAAARPGREANAVPQQPVPAITPAPPPAPPPVLPPVVDNSLLPSFPPVLSQGSQGSCVAWSTTYYQLSHEFCLANRCAMRDPESRADYWPGGPFSPAWTYNIINWGNDSGSLAPEAYQLFLENGAIGTAGFMQKPYNLSDFRSWDTDGNHWQNALNSRISALTTLRGLDTDQGLLILKQWLLNGHIVSFHSGVTSYVMRTVGPGSPHSGEEAVAYQAVGGSNHEMTIVGYDDTIWIDINGNGVVDPAERGALRIVNSWGTDSWNKGQTNGGTGTLNGNNGFFWISYDAVRRISQVPNAPVAPNRGQALGNAEAYAITVLPSIQPPQKLNNYKITAQVHFTGVQERNSIRITFGNAPTLEKSTHTYSPYLFNDKGGAHPFNGASGNGSFSFDISRLVAEGYPRDRLGRTQLYAFVGGNGGTARVTLTANNTHKPNLGPQVSLAGPIGNQLVNLVPGGATAVPIVEDAKTMRCMANQGTLLTSPSMCLVPFEGGGCPAGYVTSAKLNITTANHCSTSGSTGCRSDSCTTMYHTYPSVQAPETCEYKYYYACGGLTDSTSVYDRKTCTANVIPAGCEEAI